MARGSRTSDWVRDLEAGRPAERYVRERLFQHRDVRRVADLSTQPETPDFEFQYKNERVGLEVKSKLNPYSDEYRQLWPQVPEPDLFVLDEVALRALSWAEGMGYVVIADKPMSRWVVLGPWELLLGPRRRFERLSEDGEHPLKGKLLFDLRIGRSMVGTRDLARLAPHVRVADGCIKLIGDPDQHTAVDTGGVFKALAARDDPTLVRLVENRRQRDDAERAAIDEYRRGDIAGALDRYDTAGKVHRGDTVADTYDALVRDWWADRCAGSASPMLAGTNAARRALNERARALLKAEGVLTGEPLVAHGREFIIGDEVVARRNDRSLHAPGRREFVKNGSAGRLVAVDQEHRQVDVAFDREGVVRIPTEYLAAGHLEHAYARTTYGVQGATLDRARYHPSDSSRFEEGYVAITRATDATNVYVVDGELGLDDEDDPRAIEPDRSGLSTVVGALERRSEQQVAIETDPQAIEAAALARTHTLKELTDERRRLDAILATQPPSAADEIQREERRLASERTRLEAMQRAKPGWKPSARRQLTEKVASIAGAVAQHEDRLAELRTQQDAHKAFATEHAAELEQSRVLGLAASARRLTVRITAVADPPQAALDLVGSRPTTQRERLRWDRAVESLAVYLDENGCPWPERAETVRDVIGSQPEHFLDRYEHERIARAVREVHAPERDLGRSRGIS